MLTWLKRRRKDSYRDLWHLVYGGRNEGDKGLQRLHDWAWEIAGYWHSTTQLHSATIERVKALHTEDNAKCAHCKTKYPCKTIRTIQND